MCTKLIGNVESKGNAATSFKRQTDSKIYLIIVNLKEDLTFGGSQCIKVHLMLLCPIKLSLELQFNLGKSPLISSI